MGLSGWVGWVGIPTKTPLVEGCGYILKLVSSADAIWAHYTIFSTLRRNAL